MITISAPLDSTADRRASGHAGIAERPILLGILAVAVILRITLALRLGGTLYFADETLYVDAARRLIAGQGFGAAYARVPGYPLLLAALTAPAPGSVLLARIVQAVIAGGGGVLVYALAARMFGPTVGGAAAAIYAVDPMLAATAGLLYPEPVAAVLLTGAVLLVRWAGHDGHPVSAALGGAVLGALASFRPVALILIPPAALWVAVCVSARPARRAVHAFLLVLAAVVMLVPWTIRTYRARGTMSPISTVGARVRYDGGADDATRPLVVRFASYVRAHPRDFAARVVREFGHFWEPLPQRIVTDDPALRERLSREYAGLSTRAAAPSRFRDVASAVTFLPELALALLGLIVALRTSRRDALLLLMLILSYALGYSLFVGKLRYRIPILPLLFVLSGIGAVRVATALRRRDVRRPSS